MEIFLVSHIKFLIYVYQPLSLKKQQFPLENLLIKYNFTTEVAENTEKEIMRFSLSSLRPLW